MMAKVMTVEHDQFTVLDVAVMFAQDQLVENLIECFPPEYKDFSSALYNAAKGGRIRMVMALVDKVDAEPESVALAFSAAVSGAPMQKEVISYLARRTTSAPHYSSLTTLIKTGHLDIALYLAHRYAELATSKDRENRSPLEYLVKMNYFLSGAKLNFWERFIYKCIPLCLVDTSFDNSNDMKMTRAKRFKTLIWNFGTIPAPFIKRIGESKLRHECSIEFANLALTKMKTHMETPELLQLLTLHIVLHATCSGIYEIVKLCIKHFPELMWDKNFTKELIKEVVNGRHVELFRLVNAHNTIPYLIDNIWTVEGLLV
ncbi:uncharacterized protein LOC115688197 [Syzygium oleosum]|uniref:uncharacterized protein LOC115688197 n=1 Tax=Syzygium oleosum TaxID=219896 RepID=UPI0024BA2045|nr:uncharacterized protein LOC115688197 [Syzygium oleosum]